MSLIHTTEIRTEHDVVLARQQARQIAALLEFDLHVQTRIATAVSELARNAFQYAGGGQVEFRIAGDSQLFEVCVRDRGPGIRELKAVLDGRYTSPTGMGLGILGARRVMDQFQIECPLEGGTVVTIGKSLPGKEPAGRDRDLARIAEELARRAPAGPFEEVQRQNQELLRTLDELRRQQAETARLNRDLEETNRALRQHKEELDQLNLELEETNRGVVALYAELDERAFSMQRVSELKSRFLSDMSHEFRTPLNSIRSLAKFLLEPDDGPLSAEKERQVRYILKAAESLSELVNDLLDLARVEAGKVVLRPEDFEAADLFAALRGMFRPLLDPSSPVALVFEEPAGIPTLHTDEGKVAQIVRNFISNALKFTEQGEVRIAATRGPGDVVTFSVTDTGIGIEPRDLGRIFEEFGQVEGPVQERVKGTGLGLPLSRRLAELLGGGVAVTSRPGIGSTFTATIPRRIAASGVGPGPEGGGQPLDPDRVPVLVVEDDPATLFLYEQYLEDSGFQVLPARSVDAARRVLQEVRPAAVLLDIMLEAESGWTLLIELKGQEALRGIPVLVLTVVDGKEKALALGADEFCLKPVERPWLLDTLNALSKQVALETILIIDNDEIARYLLKGLLTAESSYAVIEAVDGREGLRRAREDRPQAIFLDLVMPDMTGFEVLDHLKSDAATRDIPVIINTTKVLDAEERRRLAAGTAILPKAGASRDEILDRVREALAKAVLGRPGRGEGFRHG